MRVGLRVDVDTLRGTRLGVPALSHWLADRGIRATFFFSVGPDNMGRHLWRLLNPAFLWKMLRSDAAGLYGWDILLRGTFWPGPSIGARTADVIRETAERGHEVGFHAWDHHAWQARLDAWDDATIRREIDRGVRALTEILGRPPTCAAAPGWRCDDRTVALREEFGFEFNSDCRGTSVFLPEVPGRPGGVGRPQVPTTLPTYDEVVGVGGATGEDYYRALPSRFDPDGLNVWTIHAEVEGISRLREFANCVDAAVAAGWSFVRLGRIAAESAEPARGHLGRSSVPGRPGWVAVQAAAGG